MTGARYQSQELYSEQGGVTSFRGVDPLTGLPVLLYSFPGRPTVGVGTLESENVPGILATHVGGDGGQLVAAYSPQYGLVAPGEEVVDDHFALEALRGMRDAARVGVTHGDLRPGRLLYADGHVLIEGYGVPWKPVDPAVWAPESERDAAPDLPGDVHALAATLLLLGQDNLSAGVRAALRGAVHPDPRSRPTASALYAEVRRLCGGAVTPPPQRFEELTLPVAGGTAEGGGAPRDVDRSLSATRSDFRLDLDLELEGELPAAEPVVPRAPPSRPAAVEPEEPRVPVEPEEPDPITLHSDPGLSPPRSKGSGTVSTGDSSPGFVKDLPPGATYRSGQLDGVRPAAPVLHSAEDAPAGRRGSWRGALLLALVVVAAGAAAALAFFNRGGVAPSAGSAGAVSYIVDVAVAPNDLPPVDLYVVRSPSGSATPAGTILTSVPRKVVFDRKGTWVVEGVFQGRHSEPASVQLPDQRSVTIRFAPLPAGGPQR